jgi:hypothetical protein
MDRTIGLPKMISMLMEYLAQTVHLSCVEIKTIFKQTEMSLHLTDVTLEYHRVCLKWFSEPMVRSTQTVHLSCIKINTISKWLETSFQFTHVTQEFHRVCPKRLPCPLCVWRKPCTYMTPTLTLSPNRLKRVPLDPSHVGVPPRAAQNDFRAYGMFGANRAPILCRD